MARKPFVGTVAENVLEHGTSGINIDECRVETREKITNHSRGKGSAKSKGKYGDSKAQETHQTEGQKLGRFPANVMHDGSDLVQDIFQDKARYFYCAKASKKDRDEGWMPCQAITRELMHKMNGQEIIWGTHLTIKEVLSKTFIRQSNLQIL